MPPAAPGQHRSATLCPAESRALKLVLASTSPYRRELLGRLGLPFEVASPGVDESARAGEPALQLAERLALAKAHAVAATRPSALVIGSDQVAWCNGESLGKPGTHDNAVAQLRRLSGRTATFYTAVCVVNSDSGRAICRTVPFEVSFRTLEDALIERYLRQEQPYDCAGSAKSEGLGIALISRMQGDDPNALVGLPLIALVDLLREHGLTIP